MDALLLLQRTVTAHGYDGLRRLLPRFASAARSAGAADAVAPLRLCRRADPASAACSTDAPQAPSRSTALYDRAEEAERLYAVAHDGLWFHVGTPDALPRPRRSSAMGSRRSAARPPHERQRRADRPSARQPSPPSARLQSPGRPAVPRSAREGYLGRCRRRQAGARARDRAAAEPARLPQSARCVPAPDATARRCCCRASRRSAMSTTTSSSSMPMTAASTCRRRSRRWSASSCSPNMVLKKLGGDTDPGVAGPPRRGARRPARQRADRRGVARSARRPRARDLRRPLAGNDRVPADHSRQLAGDPRRARPDGPGRAARPAHPRRWRSAGDRIRPPTGSMPRDRPAASRRPPNCSASSRVCRRGKLVLPGLDLGLDDAAWDAVAGEPVIRSTACVG